MSDLLFEARLEQITMGLRPGMQVLSQGLWTDARNVVFDAFGAHAQQGWELVTIGSHLFDSGTGAFDSAGGTFDDGFGGNIPLVSTAVTSITGLHTQYLLNSDRRVIFADLSTIWKYQGNSVTQLATGFTGRADAAVGYPATTWSIAPFGDWFACTNGIQVPKLCKDGATLIDLPNAPFTTAEILFTFGPHLVAANTSNGQGWIEWCSEDDPESWDPSTYPTAGNLTLRELNSALVAAAPLGQNWALFTESEMLLMRRVSAELVFGVFLAVKGIGAVSKNSVVPVGPLLYGLIAQGIFATDGSSARIASYPQFGTWLQKNINWDQKSKIAGYHARDAQEIRWCVPLAGGKSLTRTICFNYTTGAVGFSDQLFSVGRESDFLNHSMLGRLDGKVVYGDNGYGANTAAIPRYLQTAPLDFGARNRWKFVDVVQFELDAEAPMELLVGWQESPADPIQWGAPLTIAPGLAQVYPETSGVFISFLLRQTGTTYWNLSGMKVFGTVDGGTF